MISHAGPEEQSLRPRRGNAGSKLKNILEKAKESLAMVSDEVATDKGSM